MFGNFLKKIKIFDHIITSPFFQNDSKIKKIEEERENEELLKKVDLMFRRIELRDMDLQYDLFDEQKLEYLEKLYK
jgi:hypothetical protein